MRRLPEAMASQQPNTTFNQGAPLVYDTSGAHAGYVIEGSNNVSTAIIGFSNEPSHDLAADGVGGSGATYGSVPNQPKAQVIITGSPPQDGNIGVDLAVEDTLFLGYTGSSYTLVVTTPGTTFGLTRDSVSGFWFLDSTVTGLMAEAVENYDPIGTVGGRVIFKIVKAYQVLAK
jgi:hypothetical protein